MKRELEMIRSKANSAISAIRDMSAREREKCPSAAYAENYNRVRAMVLEELPSLKALLPPEAPVHESPTQGRVCSMSFAEFLSYYTELSSLILRSDDPPRGPMVIT